MTWLPVAIWLLPDTGEEGDVRLPGGFQDLGHQNTTALVLAEAVAELTQVLLPGDRQRGAGRDRRLGAPDSRRGVRVPRLVEIHVAQGGLDPEELVRRWMAPAIGLLQ